MNNYKLMNRNPAWIAACRKGLEEALGGAMKVDLAPAMGRAYDFDLRIPTKPPLRLAVEAKARIATRQQALHVIFQLRRAAGEKAPVAVFADWVPEPAAEEFRRAGVFFMDAEGNAFFRKPPQMMLDIRGRKPERPLKAEPGRLIEPGGLKVVHYLLTHPEDAGAPLRVIARGAGVALGTAHVVRVELRRAQWLLPAAGGQARLGDRKGLIDLFVRGYALKLRPACLIGRYRHKENAPVQALQAIARRLADMKDCWAVTGGIAAHELTRHLEPDTLALFVDEQAQAKLGEEPMLRDEARGNVTLLKLPHPAFIAEKKHGPWPLATPFLVYAELLQEGGAREVETARMIYEQFIEPQATHGG